METMNGRNALVDMQVWLGYDFVHTMDPVGRCGGLALFWKKNSDIIFNFVDKNLMDLSVQWGSMKFFLSCVYGHPNAKKRGPVWERISRIGVQRRLLWAMVGDFNEILSNDDKLGGPLRPGLLFQDFSDMLKSCRMRDLMSTGNSYSWGGKRNNKWIQCRLDRCVGNRE